MSVCVCVSLSLSLSLSLSDHALTTSCWRRVHCHLFVFMSQQDNLAAASDTRLVFGVKEEEEKKSLSYVITNVFSFFIYLFVYFNSSL